MKLKNEIFANVFEWLCENKGVRGQVGLSEKTGITETTISRIMNGTSEPSDRTLRALNKAFGNIFNMQYLQGKSEIMLVEDVIYAEEEKLKREKVFDPSIAAEPPAEVGALPKWADALISIMSQQIKENEALHAELRQTIREVAQLRDQLTALVNSQK